MLGRKNPFGEKAHAYSELPLLLVCGVGRSGTTVLRNVIAAHPRIECHNHESNFIAHLMRGQSLFLEEKFAVKGLGVSLKEFRDLHHQLILRSIWSKNLPPATGVKAIATYSSICPRAAIELTETFPGASFCAIFRNGIEVVSSFLSFKNFQHLAFDDVCRTWNAQRHLFAYCRDHAHAIGLRHEWIREDPVRFREELTEALAVVGVEFDEKCLKPLSKNFHPTRFEGESAAEAKDLSRREERWKLWNDRQRRSFEEICGETMSLMGYSIPW